MTMRSSGFRWCYCVIFALLLSLNVSAPKFVAEKKLVSLHEASFVGIAVCVDGVRAAVVCEQSRFHLLVSETVGVMFGAYHSISDTPAENIEKKFVEFWLESPMSMCCQMRESQRPNEREC